MPKEHGSWGMFFLPIALGFLAEGRFPFPAAWIFLAASVLVFFAREPFMTAWRLWRREQPFGPRERRGLALMAASGPLWAWLVVSGFPWLAVPVVVGAGVLVWQSDAAMRGKVRTVRAELLAVAAAMLNAPAAAYVADSGQLAPGRFLVLWLLCFLYFAGAVIYVKMRIKSAHVRNAAVIRSARRVCISFHAGLLAAAVALSAALHLPWFTAAAYVPAIARAFWYAAEPSGRELNLRQLGWTEVGLSMFWLTMLSVDFLR